MNTCLRLVWGRQRGAGILLMRNRIDLVLTLYDLLSHPHSPHKKTFPCSWPDRCIPDGGGQLSTVWCIYTRGLDRLDMLGTGSRNSVDLNGRDYSGKDLT